MTIRIDSIYYCSHDEKDNCNCRKPKIGMFLKAKKDFNIDLNKSWIIGDSKYDIIAGKNAGCKTILLINEKYYKNDILIDKGIKYNFKASNLKEAINRIIIS